MIFRYLCCKSSTIMNDVLSFFDSRAFSLHQNKTAKFCRAESGFSRKAIAPNQIIAAL